jgi:hypothetical protein
MPRHPRLTRGHCWTALALGALALGCSGSDPVQPPQLQSLTVSVTTSGVDVDPDGYSLAVGVRQSTVSSTGSVMFGDLPPGEYTVTVSGVAPNCAVVGGGTRSVTVGAAPGSQTAFEVVCESVFVAGAFTTVACPALSLSASSALPLATIPLGALPAQFAEPLFAYVRWAGGDDAALSHVRRNEDGSASMIAPYHPSGSMDGGAVSIRVGGGTTACAAVDFQIAALPDAPGELAATVDALIAVITAQATLLGTTPDALRLADPDTLSPLELPILMALSVVDHPDNPNSLRALADGTAPAANGVDASTLDRVLAAVGIRAGLQPPAALMAPSRGNDALSFHGGVSACGASEVVLAEDLDRCMHIASDAAFRLDGVSGEVLGDLGTAVGVLGSVPHPGTKLAAAGAGAVLWAFQQLRSGTALLLPSEFVDLTVEAEPEEFREDEDGPGEWTAEVRATSQGWALDRAVLDALSQIATLSGAYGAWLERFADADMAAELAGFVLNQVVARAIATTDGSDFIQIPAQTFGPVDISDAQWSERDLVPELAIVHTDHTAYEPRRVGQSILTVRSLGGRFGGRQITADPVTLIVRTLQVTISPDDVIVAPGQTREFTVRVEGAQFPELVEIDPSVTLQGEATITYNGDSTHTVSYTAPAEPNVNTPDLLTVRSTAVTGARAFAETERLDIATIRFGGIQLSAATTCVEPGDTLQIEYNVSGIPGAVLNWSTTVGTVSSTGLFVAPDEPSAATITATLATNEAVQDSIVINVGGCSCRVSLTVNGVTSLATDGFPYFELTPSLDAIESIGWTGELTSVGVWFGGDPLAPEPLPIGSNGAFTAMGSGYVDGVGTFGTPFDDPDGPRLTASIVENDGGNVLEGTVSGLVQIMANEETFGSFLFTFRITADPLHSTDRRRSCLLDP